MRACWDQAGNTFHIITYSVGAHMWLQHITANIFACMNSFMSLLSTSSFFFFETQLWITFIVYLLSLFVHLWFFCPCRQRSTVVNQILHVCVRADVYACHSQRLWWEVRGQMQPAFQTPGIYIDNNNPPPGSLSNFSLQSWQCQAQRSLDLAQRHKHKHGHIHISSSCSCTLHPRVTPHYYTSSSTTLQPPDSRGLRGNNTPSCTYVSTKVLRSFQQVKSMFSGHMSWFAYF